MTFHTARVAAYPAVCRTCNTYKPSEFDPVLHHSSSGLVLTASNRYAVGLGFDYRR